MSFGGKTRFKKGGNWKDQRTIVPKENRTSADGIVHRTRAECVRWDKLRFLQQIGQIRNLRREVKYKLERWIDARDQAAGHPAQICIKSRKGNVRTYTADFVYEKKVRGTFENKIFTAENPPEKGANFTIESYGGGCHAWEEVIEDIKGFLEPVQELRIDVFEALYGVRVFINQV